MTRPILLVPAVIMVSVLVIGGGVILVSKPQWSAELLGRLIRSTCQEEVKQEVPSGDGKYLARVFEQGCGATTNISTYLNVRSSRRWLGSSDQDVFVQENQCPLNLAWMGDTLEVGYRDSCGEIFRRVDSWSGIQIKFRTIPAS